MEVRSAFGRALKIARHKKGLTQEAFSLVSSRTFVSMLERGATSPTLEKLDDLCSVLQTHPATLLAMTYLLGSENQDVGELMKRLEAELKGLTDTN
jgi:transcriptional regulator with XRE-family HTH domain